MFKKYVFSLLGIILFVNVAHAQVSLSDRVADDAICENINKATYKAFLGVSDKKTGKTDVFQLQYFLITNRHASFTQATGFFGQGTRRAVQVFQRTHGINPTGTVGPMTRAKIFSLVCTGNGSANSATQTGSEVVASYYPKNLNISGFKIENGVAKATILDRCIEKGYKCDYNKPDTVLYTQDGQDSMQVFVGGYSIGVYVYDQINNGEGLLNGKFLILVGKDNRWRYNYLDCKESIDGTCSYFFPVGARDIKSIIIGDGGRHSKNFVYFDAEAFLNSKKSHFVLDSY